MSVVAKGVEKKYGEVQALQSVHFTMKKGEFIAVLGPSGCGKTTLLRLIAGFETLTAGEIMIDGQIMGTAKKSIPPESRNLGMVFQSFALWPHMNVAEQVEFPIRHHKQVPPHWKREPKTRVQQVLAMVNMESLADRYPHELSGGQKQRVALARAIAGQPSLLLMDEPLSSLDAELRMEMRREIQSLHQQTKTSILYVTHDQSEALAMADRIIVMKEGTIQQIGTPAIVYEKPATPYVAVFVGKAHLIPGTWIGNDFIPDYRDGELVWRGETIAPSFKERNLFPVRPEEWQLSEEGPGLPGTVKHVQYQGKEIHLTIDTGSGDILVYVPITTRYQTGDTVRMNLRLRQPNFTK